jgi:hypothetical protein
MQGWVFELRGFGDTWTEAIAMVIEGAAAPDPYDHSPDVAF